MGVETLHCQNCGGPLDFTGDEAVVKCPNCRTTNFLPTRIGSPTGVGLENATSEAHDAERTAAEEAAGDFTGSEEAQPPSIAGERSLRLNALTAELAHIRDRYRSDFTPAKDRAGEQFDREMAVYDHALERVVLVDRSKWYAVMSAASAILGFLMLEVVTDQELRQVFGGFFLIFGAVMAMTYFLRMKRKVDPRDKLRREKLGELKSAWQKWLDEDGKYRERMDELAQEIASFKE